MKNFLKETERQELKKRHRQEKDRRTADRIKAVLSDNGWSFREIAGILLLDEETISKHIDEYRTQQKLSIQTGGSSSKLSEGQETELVKHLESKTYLKVAEICDVARTCGVKYTVSGMLVEKEEIFLHKATVPAKADSEKQARFVEEYKKLKEETPKEEPILFLDAVHPTMSTKITCGWIKKGSRKTIDTTGNKTRMNIIGALNLEDMQVDTKDFKTVNGDSMTEFFDLLKEKYPDSKKIHAILDNGSYNGSKKTREEAEQRGIKLHFLPPYSPNLNPIERLWKIMNEHTGNDRFFNIAKEFQENILDFFAKTWPLIRPINLPLKSARFCDRK
jgi:transposase